MGLLLQRLLQHFQHQCKVAEDIESLPLVPLAADGVSVPFASALPQALMQALSQWAARGMRVESSAPADLSMKVSLLIMECLGVMAMLVWANDQALVCKWFVACLDKLQC